MAMVDEKNINLTLSFLKTKFESISREHKIEVLKWLIKELGN